MNKRIALLILMVISILSLPAVVLAADVGNGVIEGSLVNKTAGSTTSMAGVEVKLQTYLNDGAAAEATVKTDAKGYFIFNNLPTGANYSFQISLSYQNTDYSSESISFKTGVTNKSVDIPVYDSTTSNAAIKVTTAHTVIYTGEGGLQVKEYYLFVNDSDHSYVGTDDDKRTLRLSLPKEAADLQYGLDLMECCVSNSAEGLADTMGIPPGNREIAYLYNISSRSGKFDYSNKIMYPTDNYDLLISEGIQVSSDQLAPADSIEISGNRFNHYAQQNLKPGDVIKVSLGNIPKASKQGDSIKWIVIAVVVLGGAFGLSYALKRKRLQPVVSSDNLARRKQKLLTELADLDDSFENGQIAEGVYRKVRAAKKAQLVDIIQNQVKK